MWQSNYAHDIFKTMFIRESNCSLSSSVSWLWSEWFWLPNHTTWCDFQNSDGIYFTDVYDFKVCVPITMAFIIMRMLWDRCVGL